MDEAGSPSWTGRREPNTSLAWVVIGVGSGLLALTLVQAAFFDAQFNVWFFALLVLAMVAYGAITFTSWVAMTVELTDDRLVHTKREWSLGRVIRESALSVDRDRIAKVVERNAGLGVRVVRIEDADGGRLLIFPEFLEVREHDEMISAVIGWAGQSPSEGAGSDETPVAESR